MLYCNCTKILTASAPIYIGLVSHILPPKSPMIHGLKVCPSIEREEEREDEREREGWKITAMLSVAYMSTWHRCACRCTVVGQSVCTHIRTHTHTLSHIHTHTNTHTRMKRTHTHTLIRTQTRTYTHTHTHAQIHTHTHTHTHIHTHTHTHTHT